MSNENLNSEFHWKSKLEELKSLPGEIFNKEASWEKLHGQLQKKPGNKKALWYWAAAACLLAAISVALILSNKKENVLVNNNQVQKKIQPSPSFLRTINDSATSIVISSIPVERKSPARQAENLSKIIKPGDHKILIVENVAAKHDKEESIKSGVINNVITPVDSQISIVASIPFKKKLRVVHINELGDPVEESIMARKTETHSFQLKLATQEVFANPSVNSASTGFTILTIKNSPN